MCMCDQVKNHIATCEKSFFWFEWGYKRISGLGSPKTYCFYSLCLLNPKLKKLT